MNRLTVAVACVLAAGAAFAGEPGPAVLPEPGVLELLAIGGVIAAVIALRNRRKK